MTQAKRFAGVMALGALAALGPACSGASTTTTDPTPQTTGDGEGTGGAGDSITLRAGATRAQ